MAFVSGNRTMQLPISAQSSHYDYRDAEIGFMQTDSPVCFYIPSVSVNFKKEYIEECFSCIGSISRIDFVAIKNFQLREVDTQNRRVFIHFEGLYYTETSRYIWNCISKPDTFVPFIANLYGCNAKWQIGMAKNPVQETDLNIHQIAHVLDIVDVKVLDLEDAMGAVYEDLDKNACFNEQNMDNINYLYDSTDELRERVEKLEQLQKNSERTIFSLTNRLRELEDIIMRSKLMDELYTMMDK